MLVCKMRCKACWILFTSLILCLYWKASLEQNKKQSFNSINTALVPTEKTAIVFPSLEDKWVSLSFVTLVLMFIMKVIQQNCQKHKALSYLWLQFRLLIFCFSYRLLHCSCFILTASCLTFHPQNFLQFCLKQKSTVLQNFLLPQNTKQLNSPVPLDGP